jgi:dsRNA-specific ribonuclease
MFTYRVDTEDGNFLSEGTGKTVTESKQAAAKMALDRLLKKT